LTSSSCSSQKHEAVQRKGSACRLIYWIPIQLTSQFVKAHSYAILLSLLLGGTAHSQLETNWWYFGIEGGLEFTTGVPVPAAGGATSTFEGSSAVSDPVTGNLLFYSDGATVFDVTHAPMPNGTGLFGCSSSTQSVLIVPQPGSSTIFYVFTTDCFENACIAGTCYSVVDMTLNGGLGDVTSEKNVLLFTPNSEQLAATKHANCADYWIMTKERFNNVHRAYLLTATGLSAPVISTIGLDCGAVSYGQGKFTPDGTHYAMAAGAMVNAQLFDFDNTTGILSDPITLLNESPAFVDVYGLSFSGDNTKLYLWKGATSSGIYQYDISSGVEATILASETYIGDSPGYNQMQLARDFKIYIANSGGGNLSVIDNPNLAGAACGFSSETVPVDGFCSLGLCNFPDNYFNQVSPCDGMTAFVINSPISCFGAADANAWTLVGGGIEPFTYSWSPGGSTNDSLFNLGPGTYIVTVTDSAGTIVVDSVTITEPNELIVDANVSEDTVCQGTSTTLNATVNGGTPTFTYLWSTGADDTLSTCTNAPPSSGYIVVTVIDAHGCITVDSVYVTVLPIPGVIASPDTCICLGSSVTISASGTPGFIWSTGQSTQSITVSPSTDTWYAVSYSNGVCSTSDSIFVCVHPVPVIFASADTSIQYGGTAYLQSSGTGPFHWSPPNSLSCTPCANPTATPETSTTYTVSTTNEFGCSAFDQILVLVSYKLVIPNIFTPNQDGKNDVFEIQGLPSKSRLIIYNRWGNEMYSTDSYPNDWTTGTDGVYFYVLATPDGKFFSGFVQVTGH